jgi:hypothetical protein
MWKEEKVKMCKTENNIVEENGEQIMNFFLHKLLVQRKFWKGHK